MKVLIILIVIGALGTVTEELVKELEDMKITGQVETIQATTLLRLAKIQSPGDLRRLAVTQTTVKDHQLMLM